MTYYSSHQFTTLAVQFAENGVVYERRSPFPNGQEHTSPGRKPHRRTPSRFYFYLYRSMLIWRDCRAPIVSEFL